MRISDLSSDVCSSDLSTWLLSRREVEALEGPPPPPNVKPGTLSGRRQAKVEPVELDRDVFGDGTVKILHANGHTAGHQVLQVKLANSGTVILSGDLFHTRENFEQNRMPVFNDSRSEEHTSELQSLMRI